MIGLHLAGVLDRSATFPQRLDPKEIRNVRLVTGPSSVGYMVELLSALRGRAEDGHIAQALAHLVRKERIRRRIGELLAGFPALRAALQPARTAVARYDRSTPSPVAVSR